MYSLEPLISLSTRTQSKKTHYIHKRKYKYASTRKQTVRVISIIFGQYGNKLLVGGFVSETLLFDLYSVNGTHTYYQSLMLPD